MLDSFLQVCNHDLLTIFYLLIQGSESIKVLKSWHFSDLKDRFDIRYI